MVEVRISRQSGEVVADSGAPAGVTRVDTEVAGKATQANTETVQVSRQCGEVVAKNVSAVSLTRLDTEVAGKATQANTETVQVSRQSGEVIANISPIANTTRLDVEVAGRATMAAPGETVRITRMTGEAVARRGSAGPVSPLAVPAGWELFLHNWISSLRLNSSWNTSIKRSPVTGAESRRGFILKPDRTMKLVWQTDDRDRLDRLYVMLRKLTNQRGPVPLYCDQRVINASYLSTDDTVFIDTSKGRWFVGARVAIVQYDFAYQYASHSFHIIADMQDDQLTFTAPLGVDVSEGSTIVPMMDCEVVLEAELQHETALNGKLELTVAEVPGASALPPTKADTPVGGQVFQNIPIWDIDPNWIQGIKKGRSRAGKKYGQGKAERVFTEADRSRETHELFLQGERDDIWRAVEFFDTRRGTLRMFWMIDHDSIWETVGLDGSGNFININEFGQFADFQDELEGEWVGLLMEDGTVYVRQAVTVQQVLTVYRITVSPSLPAGLDFTKVVRAARARVTRFEKDEMEEEWTHTGLMNTRLSFIEMLSERDADIF